jgi:hypothetical protein
MGDDEELMKLMELMPPSQGRWTIPDAARISIAISLKRIADMLQRQFEPARK